MSALGHKWACCDPVAGALVDRPGSRRPKGSQISFALATLIADIMRPPEAASILLHHMVVLHWRVGTIAPKHRIMLHLIG
jgi:hypothetical protein